ncbi:MAG: hypothetical protein JWO15_3746 [Sphingomonadales bacterium]|nr:hypothetical protein [Sphingomonadales bacterium]
MSYRDIRVEAVNVEAGSQGTDAFQITVLAHPAGQFATGHEVAFEVLPPDVRQHLAEWLAGPPAEEPAA